MLVLRELDSLKGKIQDLPRHKFLLHVQGYPGLSLPIMSFFCLVPHTYTTSPSFLCFSYCSLGFFFLQRFFQLTVSTRGHLSWLGGWLRGCIHSCVCQQRHTQQHVPPLVKDTAWEGRLLIEIHHTGTLLSLSTQLVTKLSIAMFGVQLSQCRQITASPSGRHVRKEKM